MVFNAVPRKNEGLEGERDAGKSLLLQKLSAMDAVKRRHSKAMETNSKSTQDRKDFRNPIYKKAR